MTTSPRWTDGYRTLVGPYQHGDGWRFDVVWPGLREPHDFAAWSDAQAAHAELIAAWSDPDVTPMAADESVEELAKCPNDDGIWGEVLWNSVVKVYVDYEELSPAAARSLAAFLVAAADQTEAKASR